MMLLACLIPISALATDFDDGTVKDLNEDIDDEYAKIESEMQNQKENSPNILKNQDDVSGDEGPSEMMPNNMDRSAISTGISTESETQESSSSNRLVSKKAQEDFSTGIEPTRSTEVIATGSSRFRMSSSSNRLVNKETNEDHSIGPRSEISTGSQSNNKETLEDISTGPLSAILTAGNGSKISSANNRLVNEEIRDDLSAGPQSTISTDNRSMMTSSNNRSVNKDIPDDLSIGHRSAISIGNGSKMSVIENIPAEDLSTGPRSAISIDYGSKMSVNEDTLEDHSTGPQLTSLSYSWSEMSSSCFSLVYVTTLVYETPEVVADDRSGIWSEVWSGFGETKNDAEVVSRDPYGIYCRTKSRLPVETKTAPNNWTFPGDFPDVLCDDKRGQSPGVKENIVVLSDDKSKQSPEAMDDRSEVEGRDSKVEGREVDDAVFGLILGEKEVVIPKEKKKRRCHTSTKNLRPRQVKLSKVFLRNVESLV